MKRLFLLPIFLLFTFINAQEYIMQNGSVTTCSGTLYDSGGSSSNYSPNENFVYTICPDHSTNPELVTVLDFSYLQTQINIDVLNIYDGTDTSAPLIATLSGGAGSVVSASDIGTNSSGCLTIEFTSDPVWEGGGWEATISCQVPCQKITPAVTTTPAMNSDGNVEILETETVQFTSNTTFSQDGAGATYQWDFGDGNTATGESTTNTYNTAGTYTVTLTVTDPDGCSKTYTFLVIVSYNINVPCPGVNPRDVQTETPDNLTIDCNYPLASDGGIRLEANFTEIKGTESYVVQSLPYQPPFEFIGLSNQFNVNIDDSWAGYDVFPNDFSFCFFGEHKTHYQVGANGNLSFNNNGAANVGGSCDYGLAQDELIPTASIHKNSVMLYHDICPQWTGSRPNNQVEIGYEVLGEIPCRALVVSYANVPHYIGYNQDSGVNSTFMMVLYEASNIIDFYVQDKPPGQESFTNNGRAVLGIQNETGTQGYTPPGRNTGLWSAQNEAWRFLPDGDPLQVTIVWYDEDGNEVGQGDEYIAYPNGEDVTYTVKVTYEICGQDPLVVEDDISITFDIDSPSVDDFTITRCDTDGDGLVTWDLVTETEQAIASSQGLTIQGYYAEYRDADQANTAAQITSPEAYVSGEGTAYVRIVGSNGCYAIVTITLDIPDGLEIAPLSDSFCIQPNNTDVTIDLSQYSQQISSTQIIQVYYYATQADAQANTNNLEGTDLTEFTISETTTVYIRVVAENGCFGLSELTLEINQAAFDYTFDNPVQFCDSDPTGEEVVNLTGYESNIANGQTGVTFLYFEVYQDALDNTTASAITNPTQYTLTTSVTELYILVQDANGCRKIITMPVSLTDGFALTPQTYPLCDIGNDGSETFDLTSKNNEIIANSTDYTFKYYPTQQDLNDNTNEITNPTSFVSGATTIYVLVSNTNDCSSSTTITLELNTVPVANPTSLSVCPDANGALVFNLNDAESDLLNGQTGITLTYYNSQADAESGDNAISDPSNYTGTDGEIVYVNMVLGDCKTISQVTLNASAVPTAVQPNNITVCDVDASGNEEVDLTTVESTVIGSQTNITVTYYLSQADADAETNAIATPATYLASVGTTTIYVRLENDSECSVTTMFDVVVNSGPTLIPQSITLCDIGNDGSETFDLTSKNNEIIANSTDYTFKYYPTQQDLNDNTNEITNPTSFVSGATTIYVLVSNTNDCSSSTTITLELNTVPVASPTSLSVCPDANGALVFNLNDAESDLLNGQTGITLTYHNSQADAENGDNAISDPSNYTGTDGEIVYVNMVLGDCKTISQVTLNASAVPTAVQPNNITVCDVDASGNEEVDLTTVESTVIGSQTNITVTYYLSQADADAETNAIATPATYLASVGTTTIYVRLENDSECSVTTMFDVVVNSGPTLTPQSITLCDIGNDGSETFDLTSKNNEIIANSTDYTFKYYPTQQDLNDNTNEITNPTSFVSGATTIYVLVDGGNNCPSSTQLQLILKALPAVTNNQMPICDPNFDSVYSFNLTDLNDLVVTNTSNYSFEYYTSLADAQNMVNPITQADANNITTVPFNIYVKITEVNGEPLCSNFAVVELTQGNQSQVNTNIDAVSACDEGNGMATFDFSTLTVTTETGSNTQISFHRTMEDAQNNTGVLDASGVSLSTGTVFVRVKAEGKCPSITQFNVEVIAKPVAEITSSNFSLCANDNITLTASNYNSAYQYVWTNQDGTVLGNTETINVSGTSGDQEITLTVTNPSASTACPSQTTQEIDVISTATIVSLDVSGTTITVQATGQGPFEYSIDGVNWQISNELTVPQAGYYNVYVRSYNLSCEGVGSATLVLDVNNIITPNGDGVNDVFVLPFMDVFKDEDQQVQPSNFSVYDRNGKLIYSDTSSNTKVQFTWDGSYKGRVLPSGDYWYLLKLADGRELSGHITVKNR